MIANIYQQLILKGISNSHILKYRVESFVDLSQQMSEELHLNTEEIVIQQFLKDVKKIVTPLLNEDVIFCIIKDNLLPKSICIDGERLMQIVLRIIQNAIKYTTKGNIVLEVCLRAKDDLEFSVSDDGIGMNAKTIQLIKKSINSFVADAPRQENSQLNGLGLAVAQLLLEKMGTSLHISSEMGKGSRFSFIITMSNSSFSKKILEVLFVIFQKFASLK